jgi:hypothetical protein
MRESVPFGGDAAQQEGGANCHGRGCYGADGSAEVDGLSEGFAGGVKELAVDSDWLLLGDTDRSGESVLGSVCLVGGEGARKSSCPDSWAQPSHMPRLSHRVIRFGHAGRDC